MLVGVQEAHKISHSWDALNSALRSFPVNRYKSFNNNILQNLPTLYSQPFFKNNYVVSLAIYSNVSLFRGHFLGLCMGKKKKRKADVTGKTEFDIRKSNLCFLTTAGYIPRHG